MTAVMLETVRKGMWNATDEQIRNMAELHTELIKDYGAACSGFVCDNAKLRDFISDNVASEKAREYNSSVAAVRAENISTDDGMVMKREEINGQETQTNRINGLIVGCIVLVVLIVAVFVLRHRRKNRIEE